MARVLELYKFLRKTAERRQNAAPSFGPKSCHACSPHPTFHLLSTPQWRSSFIKMSEKALYACDQCYRCKTRCEKELPRCQRCQKQNNTCTYSVTALNWLALASEPTLRQDAANQEKRQIKSEEPVMNCKAGTKMSQNHMTVNVLDASTSSDQQLSRLHGKVLQDGMEYRSSHTHSNRGEGSYAIQPQSVSIMLSPTSIEGCSTSISGPCNCISRNMTSTRDIYLGSLQWDLMRDFAALQNGLASCEPDADCGAIHDEKAVISSVLFLERALMCMKQPSFCEVVAFGGNEMVMQCVAIANRLQRSTLLLETSSLHGIEILARTCTALKQDFETVRSTMR